MSGLDRTALERATEILNDNLVAGDVDDDTAVFTTGGLIGSIAEALTQAPAPTEASAQVQGEPDAGLVAAWLKRGAKAQKTLALKAAEAAKGSDWVIAVESIQSADLVALADYLRSQPSTAQPAPAAPAAPVTDAMVAGLDRLEAIIHELTGEVAPNGPEDRAWATINEMRAALEAALPQPREGWQPIETASKDGTKFDVWYPPHLAEPGYRLTDVYWSGVQDAFCTDGPYGPEEPAPLMLYPQPTHWRPTPTPPTKDQTSGESV